MDSSWGFEIGDDCGEERKRKNRKEDPSQKNWFLNTFACRSQYESSPKSWRLPSSCVGRRLIT
ncbi:hypothetical protein PanWU01x14_238810 [Parasponia andersonii]|uniref:Uncharacterized protein n=1 Tax=Parasponia andersonii TaxID=3476 RepID=A0A2P5BHF5_PARAD|nr:hypothetical protein PanWU01x14_238810 [Parasponia andersonii]